MVGIVHVMKIIVIIMMITIYKYSHSQTSHCWNLLHKLGCIV